jgi:hypothetical protein
MPWVLPGTADAGDVYTATAHNIIVEDMRTLAAAGTVLPSSPGDGESFYYVADATNGVVWHLRYRSAATGSYKWEYVGGAEYVSESTTNFVSTTSVTYGNPSGGAMPTIVCPLAGDYDVTVYAEDARLVTNSGRGFISYTIAGAAALDANALIRGTFASGDDNSGTMISKNRITGVSATSTLALVTKVTGTATFFPNGNHGVTNAAVGIRIVPVRLG